MEKKLTSWDIAWGVFGGLMLFSVTWLIVGIIFAAVMTPKIEEAQKAEIQKGLDEFKRMMPAAPAPTAVVPQQHAVTVPAKSVEECLAASNGVADVQYAKCRQTHQELRY